MHQVTVEIGPIHGLPHEIPDDMYSMIAKYGQRITIINGLRPIVRELNIEVPSEKLEPFVNTMKRLTKYFAVDVGITITFLYD